MKDGLDWLIIGLIILIEAIVSYLLLFGVIK